MKCLVFTTGHKQKSDQSDKCFIEWKSIEFFRALSKYFQHDTPRRPNIRGTFRIVRSIRIIRASWTRATSSCV